MKGIWISVYTIRTETGLVFSFKEYKNITFFRLQTIVVITVS